jgi:nitroreductase
MTIPIDIADELLTTTRAVRKRLDLTRPVPREVILECIHISQQAPTGSNQQGWRWLVVTDAAKKAALADLCRSFATGLFDTLEQNARDSGQAQTARVYSSAHYLLDHLHEVPAMVIPCQLGRPGDALGMQAAFFASIYPAVWSFNLALRARGLGATLTTIHLMHEKQAAAILGIPDDVTMTALLPVAYTIGDGFKPATRPPAEEITFFDTWGGKS